MATTYKDEIMSNMIIGLSGKRGVGKTALANYLHRHHGFTVVSFAGPLKKLAEDLYPGISKAPKEKPFASYDWTPREFMVRLGDFMRYHEQDYWLNRGLEVISKPGRWVFDDVRFKNEAEALKKSGAKLVRINRYEKDNPYGRNLDIPSETELDDYGFDHVIEDCVNNSLKQLYNEGDVMLKTLG